VPSYTQQCYTPQQAYWIIKDSSGQQEFMPQFSCLSMNENININGFIGNDEFRAGCSIQEGKILNSFIQPNQNVIKECFRVKCFGSPSGMMCPTFSVEFDCNESVKIGNEIFEPKAIKCDTYRGFKWIANYTKAPSENEEHFVNGSIGDKNFTISYTVTKELC